MYNYISRFAYSLPSMGHSSGMSRFFLNKTARRQGHGGNRGARGAGPGGGKPQKIIQSPDKQYRAPTDHTKPQKDYAKTYNIRHKH